MEGAIGALFFLLTIGAIIAFCYRHRETLVDWLNGIDKQPSDSKLAELKKRVEDAKQTLGRYQKRLRLQEKIKNANQEIENLDKTETGG